MGGKQALQSNDYADFLYYFSKECAKENLLCMLSANSSIDSIHLRVR